uniref:Kinesin motor domain-containing protein n=1 Tax=Timema cristinae TaxID=61476 RepID=A0A7R9CGM3_TIMCR|nr:unnamed protein product [Timema cristinae]
MNSGADVPCSAFNLPISAKAGKSYNLISKRLIIADAKYSKHKMSKTSLCPILYDVLLHEFGIYWDYRMGRVKMAESVKVIVRCRPMNTREKDLDCKPSVAITGLRHQFRNRIDYMIRRLGFKSQLGLQRCVVFMDHAHCTCSIVNPNDGSAPPKAFTFDGVYHVNSTTEQIYNEIAYPLVEIYVDLGTYPNYGRGALAPSIPLWIRYW